MATVALLAVGVPSLFGVLAWGKHEGFRPNQLGIALQTVIIIVVLLIIAGGVAAVLLNRGQQAVTELERQDITTAATNIQNFALCRAAGHNWTEATARSGKHCKPAG